MAPYGLEIAWEEKLIGIERYRPEPEKYPTWIRRTYRIRGEIAG